MRIVEVDITSRGNKQQKRGVEIENLFVAHLNTSDAKWPCVIFDACIMDTRTSRSQLPVSSRKAILIVRVNLTALTAG